MESKARHEEVGSAKGGIQGLYGLSYRDVDIFIRDVLGTDHPENFYEFSNERKKDWLYEKTHEKFPCLPESLVNLCIGSLHSCDCGRPEEELPKWLDLDKFKRGQEFAQKYAYALMLNIVVSFFLSLTLVDGLKPLIFTRKSSTPYTAFRRYLSTVNKVHSWYTGELWRKGSTANNDIKLARGIHLKVREKLLTCPDDKLNEAAEIRNPWSPTRDVLVEDFRNSCAEPDRDQCPFLFLQEHWSNRLKGLSQAEMSITQFVFVGCTVLFPKHFGMQKATHEELEAFCHLWRSIGYLLGIDDEFNFCRGTLEEIQQRSRDLLEIWIKPNLRHVTIEWEHMARCLAEGVRYFLPVTSFEAQIMRAMMVLNVEIPRFKSRASLYDKFFYNFYTFLFHLGGWIPGLRYIYNGIFHYGMNIANNFSQEQLKKLRQKSAKTWKFQADNTS